MKVISYVWKPFQDIDASVKKYATLIWTIWDYIIDSVEDRLLHYLRRCIYICSSKIVEIHVTEKDINGLAKNGKKYSNDFMSSTCQEIGQYWWIMSVNIYHCWMTVQIQFSSFSFSFFYLAYFTLTGIYVLSGIWGYETEYSVSFIWSRFLT